MRYLLDTHLLIWLMAAPGRFPASARAMIEADDAQTYYSIATVWEVAIKHRLGRMDFALPPQEFAFHARQSGLAELPITAAACFRVAELPLLHRDPFDRMLVAQAMATPMHLLTADRGLAGYSELVRVFA